MDDELFIDDTPLDIDKFMSEHTKEEIEAMYKELFGEDDTESEDK